MNHIYMNSRTRPEVYRIRDEELDTEEVAISLGGRATRFSTDDTPHSITLLLADGPSSIGGIFAYELDQAEILYRQLGALLGKDQA